MKVVTISALLLTLAAPVAAVELPTFSTKGPVKVRVRNGEIIDEQFKTTPTEVGQGDYNNPIDRQIAIATYEFTHGDEQQAFDRLEKVLPQADSGRRLQIESQLFLNYIHLSLLPAPDRSERWLKRASELKPNDPRPYRQLRELYCYRQNFHKCKAAHQEAVKRSPDEVFELQLLATTLMEISEYGHSVEVIQKAIEAEREKVNPDREIIKDLQVFMSDVVKLSR